MRYTTFVRLSHKYRGIMSNQERDYMGGLAKGLKVIEAFSPENPRLSITEAAEIAMLDRATTRRCLLTLAKLGYCSYDGKFFTVTPRILRLGAACLNTMPMARLVQPTLDTLSEKINQSTSVSILDDTEIVYIERASQRRVMSISLMPGSRLPAYCTSMGRVLLASLDEEAALHILQHSRLVKRTQYTCTDIDQLMLEFSKIRTLGYAIINQEVELGLRSIAIPLTNLQGKTIAAMNVGLPSNTETIKTIENKYLTELNQAKVELSNYLN